MNRRKFLGNLAKGVAVATVAPTVIASALNTPTPAMSVTTRAFSGSVSGAVEFCYHGKTFLYQQGIDKTAEKFKL